MMELRKASNHNMLKNWQTFWIDLMLPRILKT